VNSYAFKEVALVTYNQLVENSGKKQQISKERLALLRASILAMIIVLLGGAFFVIVSFFVYRDFATNSYANQASGIATGIAGSIDPIRFAESIEGETPDEYWYDIYNLVNTIFSRLHDVAYIYITVPYRDGLFSYYVSSAIPSGFLVVETDPNVFGENSTEVYLHGSIVTTGIIDAGGWGALVAGLSPIFCIDGNVIGLVGVDFFAQPFLDDATNLALLLGAFVVILSGFTGVILYRNNKRVIIELVKASEIAHKYLDSSPLLIEIWDEDFNVIDCNQQTLDMFGLSSKEEYIARYDEFIPEFQPCGTPSKQLNEIYAKKVIEEGVVRHEWMHQFSDGTPLPAEVTCVRVEQNGKSLILGYTHDLREVKKAMDETRAADERAALLLDAMPLASFMTKRIIGEDGALSDFSALDCNEAALDLFGFSSKEEAVSRLKDIYPLPSNGTSVEETTREPSKIAYEKGSHRFEFDLQSTDGTPIPCDVILVRVHYKGEPALACFINDLRREKRMEDAEKKAHVLLEALPEPCVLFDEDFNMLDCNQATLNLFLISKEIEIERYPKGVREEWIDKCTNDHKNCKKVGSESCLRRKYFMDNYRYIFPGYPEKRDEIEEGFAMRCQEAIEESLENKVYRFKYEHLTLYGEPVLCEISIVPVKLEKTTGFACYIRDIRDEKRRLIAEEENMAKTQFLTRMSHEIRTPLNSVIGISEIELQKDIHIQEIEDAFRRIYNSSRLLLAIINDILDLSKVEAGKMEIIPVAYETASLIADTVQLNLMDMGSKRIDFILEIDEALPMHLIGDEIRIKQIFNNLISNAFKYTDEGSVTLKLWMEESSEDDSITLAASVIDTGQGMSQDQLDKLFYSEFTRFNLQQNRTVEGYGLGMTITFSLVNMMGGDIKVHSELGQGSIFTVYIPQKLESKRSLDKEVIESLRNFESVKSYMKEAATIEHEPMPYGSVLVVDDVESNLYVAKGLLKPYKLDIETASSGIEAIGKVKDGNVYDIIFMDYMMPDMDGIETIKILHDMGYNQPIIAFTANATIGASKMFLDNGFSGFISKPLNPSRLDAYLKKYIYAKQSPEVIEAAKTKYPKRSNEADNVKNISGKLRESFLIDASKSIVILESMMQIEPEDTGALRLYVIQVHAVKSALTNIGCTDLAKTAGILEEAGRNNDIDTIKSTTPRFLDDLRRTVKALTRRRRDDILDDEEDSVYIGEQLLAIAEACEAYDTQRVQSLLNALKEVPFSRNTTIAIEKIEKHLLLSDDDKAARLARITADKILKKEAQA